MTGISEFCIKRPVFATVLNLMLLVLGVVFFMELQVRDTPDIDPPIITVTASYPGADALYMEDVVTKTVERALKTTKNLDSMISKSSNGEMQITMSFDLDADLDSILSDIRSKISDVSYSLPDDMRIPTAARFDSDAFPSMWISVSSNVYSSPQLTDIINDNIKAPLERIENVGQAQIFGGRYYSMIIEPDPVKLYRHKIAPVSIAESISQQTQNYPAGEIKTKTRNFNLRMDNIFSKKQDFENIILKKDGEYLLKIADVAQTYLKPTDRRSILRYNEKQAIAIGIIKQSGTNLITLSRDVKLAVKKIKASLPKGVDIEVAYDGAVPVNASIRAVFSTIFEALIFVMIVTWLFLSSSKITIIPFVTIPISLIATFAVMYSFGFSINNFTLLAMILAIGLVVDDAIIVMENIFRYVEEGMEPFDAAIKGTRQIVAPVIAMTITLAAVFLPVGFIKGFVGKLFIEFAWTLAFCVLFSGFVALTLTPVMCRYMANQTQQKSSAMILVKFNEYFESLQNSYIYYLKIVLSNSKKSLAFAGCSVIILIISFIFVNKTFVPEEDNGFLRVAFSGIEGGSLELSEKTVLEAEKIFISDKDVLGFFEVINPGGAFAFIPLVTWADRSRSQFEVRNSLNAKLTQIPGMSIFAMNPRSIGGFFGSLIEFTISGGMNYAELNALSKDIISQMESTKIFANVDSDLKMSIPTFDIEIQKDKAYMQNLSIGDIGTSIQYLIAGKSAGQFRMNDNTYDVLLKFSRDLRSDIKNLDYIWVKNSLGDLVPISSVASIKEVASARSYNHYNTARSVTITADLQSGATIDIAAQKIKEILKNKVNYNKSRVDYGGEIERLEESNSNLALTFLMALIFIYLVLCAQFESFTDPLIILLAVPFSITGGVLALLISGNSINMYSNIGLITLIGLITKNSIMLVEFTSELRRSGEMNKISALIEAASIRLRPIMMTTLATIFGALPLVFGSGAGAASRASIGITIIGGMLVGTVFTIFVIPIIYNIFKKDAA